MRAIRSFKDPTDRAYRNLRTYFTSNNPLYDEDAEYVMHREDLVTMRVGESPSFEGRVESLLLKLDSRVIRVS